MPARPQGLGWWRAALLVALAAVTLLAVMPQAEVPVTTSWDKSDHLLAFFVLTLLAERSFPQQPFWRYVAPALLAYGGALEIFQYFTPSRFAAWSDLAADAIGIVLYGVARRWLPAALRSASPAAD